MSFNSALKEILPSRSTGTTSAARSPQTAERFRAAVQAAAEKAAENPTLYAAVDAIHRSCCVDGFPFRIFFQHDDTKLIVIAVSHSRRKPGYWRHRT